MPNDKLPAARVCRGMVPLDASEPILTSCHMQVRAARELMPPLGQQRMLVARV